MRGIAPFFALVLAVTACGSGGSDASPPPPGQAPPDATPDTPPDPATGSPCPRLAGGPAGAGTPLVDFAHAVGAYRFFGPGADATPGEKAIAAALATSGAITSGTLDVFANGLDGACARAADTRGLGAVSVTQQGSVAVVRPGTGDVVLPAGAASVAIDLRDVPEAPGLAKALAAAFAAASKTGISLADERFRECNGEPDEVYSVLEQIQNVYACTESDAPGAALTPSGDSDRPIVLLTGATIAPTAARFGVSLRARKRAWLFGEDVVTAIAESDWFGVGGAGVAVRSRSLLLGGKLLPDFVSADVRAHDPLAAWTTSPHTDAPPALKGAAARAGFAARPIPTAARKPTDAPGEARAALVIAYATVSTFWPYVVDLAAPIDTRLPEAMAQLDAEAASGRAAVRRALGRFTEAMSDGHVGIYDFGATQQNGYAPLAAVALGPDVVVGVSATDLVSPGETILAIDGKPIADVMTAIERVTSCSPHEKPTFATDSLFNGTPAPKLHLRALDGTERDVTTTSVATPPYAFGMWDRAPGPLTDLGAPDVFYVTLDTYGAFPPSKNAPTVIDQGLAAARAVVLDVRGYPEAASWDVLAKIIPSSSHGPSLAMLDVTPDASVQVPDPAQTLGLFAKQNQTFSGPVVLLVGHDSQSQAEHLTSFFKDSKRGKVIGVQTSGANGNITGIQLPGGYGITFTGMHVAHQDGSRFFGLGHVPDVIVEPTAQDFHDHHDAVLAKAIELLAP